MTSNHGFSAEQAGPSTSAGAWGLRHPGLIMGKGGKNEVKEFTGMWREHPQATAEHIATFVAHHLLNPATQPRRAPPMTIG